MCGTNGGQKSASDAPGIGVTGHELPCRWLESNPDLLEEQPSEPLLQSLEFFFLMEEDLLKFVKLGRRNKPKKSSHN